MKKIVVATQNKGKVKEIKEILGDLPVQVKTMGEIGIDLLKKMEPHLKKMQSLRQKQLVN